MEQYILAHDFGTSADKASLFNTDGQFISTITTPYHTNHSNSTWAEQDPEDWWNAFCTGNRELLKGCLLYTSTPCTIARKTASASF